MKRKLILWLAVPFFVIAILVAGGWSFSKYKYAHARKMWKDHALVQIATTSMTNGEVLIEINQIKNPTPDLNFSWANQHVLLMTNGEFMVFAFYHGFNSGFVDHLFLAHGSDGRWYYSTYHFCNGMASVIGEDAPGSIAEFANRYSVRQFDGKSEICLQHTWP